MTVETAISTMLSAVHLAMDFTLPEMKSVYNLHDIRLVVEAENLILGGEPTNNIKSHDEALSAIYMAIMYAGSHKIFTSEEAIKIVEALDTIRPMLPEPEQIES